MSLRALSALPLVLVTAFALSACSDPGDPDPGACNTQGLFNESWVEANTGRETHAYVQMVCSDWVNMLLANCVEIYNLPLAPSAADIADFCFRNTHGDQTALEFIIDHSCNFVDNQNFECRAFATKKARLGSPVIATVLSDQVLERLYITGFAMGGSTVGMTGSEFLQSLR